MEIVIFEDDMDFVHSLESIIERFRRKNPRFSVGLVTADFNSLLRYIELLEKPTIFLLDIMFGNCAKGFKIADVINKQQLKAVIVFITAYPRKILINSLYKIKAFNVILKSSVHLEQEIAITLQEALKYFDTSSIIVYSDKFTTVLVEVAGIYYVETINNQNKIRIHSKCGVYELRTSLSRLMKQLPSGFIRCHNAYIVNLCKIASINHSARSIKMKDGSTCYYSERNRKALIESVGVKAFNAEEPDK